MESNNLSTNCGLSMQMQLQKHSPPLPYFANALPRHLMYTNSKNTPIYNHLQAEIKHGQVSTPSLNKPKKQLITCREASAKI